MRPQSALQAESSAYNSPNAWKAVRMTSSEKPAEASPPDKPHSDRLSGPFGLGALVMVTLAAPREKFWGAILSLSAAGISLRGCELVSFEDFVAMTRSGEGFTPSVVFFPMHRVERMEADAAGNGLPSLAERFARETGVEVGPLLGEGPRS